MLITRVLPAVTNALLEVTNAKGWKVVQILGHICEIKDTKDTMKLQKDIDRLGSWARKWGMRFQPVKCNMMQLIRKQIKKIHASYTLEGTNLENVESIKYLRVTI